MANSDEQARSPVSRLVDGVFGAALEAQDAVAGGLTALWDVNKRMLETTEKLAAPVLAPLDALGVTNFVRQPVQAVAEQVEATFTQFEERGRQSINAGTFLPTRGDRRNRRRHRRDPGDQPRRGCARPSST